MRPRVWLLLLAPALVGQLITLAGRWNPSWDGAQYIGAAESLAAGEGYRLQGADVVLPPGFPAALAAIELVAGRSFLAMRALELACSFGVLLCTWRLVQRRRPDLAGPVTLVLAYSFPLWQCTTEILTDLPFAFLALIALERGDVAREHGRRRDFAMALLAALAATYVRTVGGLVALAVGIALFREPGRRARTRAAAWLAAFALGLVPWLVYSRSAEVPDAIEHPVGWNYGQAWSLGSDIANPRPITPRILAERCAHNAVYYAKLFAGVAAGRNLGLLRDEPWTGRVLLGAFVAGVGTLVLVGFARALRAPSPAEWFAPLLGLLYLTWPSHQGERFLLPVLPLLLLWLFLGLERCAGSGWRRVGFPATALLVMVHVSADLELLRRERAGEVAPEHLALAEACGWLAEHTPDTAVVCGGGAPIVHLLSGRAAYCIPAERDVPAALERLEALEVDYLITSPTSRNATRLGHELVAAYPERFAACATFGPVAVWAFERASPVSGE